MFCTACGNQMAATDRHCAGCGSMAGEPVPGAPPPRGQRPGMMRDMANKKIAGVCAGLARHMEWDVTLIRVAFLAAILFKGLGLIAYIVAWIAMPRDDIRAVSAAR